MKNEDNVIMIETQGKLLAGPGNDRIPRWAIIEVLTNLVLTYGEQEVLRVFEKEFELVRKVG